MLQPDDLRRAMARMASGVVVVTTVVDGFDHAMTANSFTSVSLDPPLVLFCVQRDVRFHDAVRNADGWVVNLLADHQAVTARWFAQRGRQLAGQMDDYPYTRTASGIAVLEGTIGHLECTTEVVYPGGDHSIVLGLVQHIGPVRPDSQPLVFIDHRLGAPGEFA